VVILSPNISQQDASISLASVGRLRTFLSGADRSLVFFAGAGASTAGNTGMPSTPNLLQWILLDALKRVVEFEIEGSDLAGAITDISDSIGFEITLNDLWQTCREATILLYRSLAEYEQRCTPNQVHSLLAYWLTTGGIVLTTNYDCLIEREC